MASSYWSFHQSIVPQKSPLTTSSPVDTTPIFSQGKSWIQFSNSLSLLRATVTTTRPCPSPYRNASFLVVLFVWIEKPSSLLKPLSHNVTNRPPSLTSCADLMSCPDTSSSNLFCNLNSSSKLK